jgi:hypothetical protein
LEGLRSEELRTEELRSEELRREELRSEELRSENYEAKNCDAKNCDAKNYGLFLGRRFFGADLFRATRFSASSASCFARTDSISDSIIRRVQMTVPFKLKAFHFGTMPYSIAVTNWELNSLAELAAVSRRLMYSSGYSDPLPSAMLLGIDSDDRLIWSRSSAYPRGGKWDSRSRVRTAT